MGEKSEIILDQLRIHSVNQKSLLLIHLQEGFWLTTNHAIWQMNYLLDSTQVKSQFLLCFPVNSCLDNRI